MIRLQTWLILAKTWKSFLINHLCFFPFSQESLATATSWKPQPQINIFPFYERQKCSLKETVDHYYLKYQITRQIVNHQYLRNQ